jgi:type VI secretion system ImpM family protein
VSVSYLGKLPSQGDFIQRGLTPDLAQALDAWISQAMAGLRQRPDWLERYLSSPSWQFQWQGQLLGGKPLDTLGAKAGRLCGVIAPSVDRVGRYFPFIAVLDDAGSYSHAAMGQALDAMDGAILQAIDEDWAPEVLHTRLCEAAEAAKAIHPLESHSVRAFSGPGEARLFSVNDWGHLALLGQQAQSGPNSWWIAKPEGETPLGIQAGDVSSAELALRLWGGLDELCGEASVCSAATTPQKET